MTKKRLISLVMIFSLFVSLCNVNLTKAAGFGGADRYNFSWTAIESKNLISIEAVKYSGTATYDSSFIVLLDNLSGTKYWGNYQNRQKTAQSLSIGISEETTVSSTNSFTISLAVGMSVPIKAYTISGKIGGSYTNSKTYSKTVGTSSEYTLNTNSKNGYYAVTHAANCDAYNVVLNRNGSYCSSGKLIRYASSNGYERLWYSTSVF